MDIVVLPEKDTAEWNLRHLTPHLSSSMLESIAMGERSLAAMIPSNWIPAALSFFVGSGLAKASKITLEIICKTYNECSKNQIN